MDEKIQAHDNHQKAERYTLNSENNKIFIDGKGQVIEMLKWMKFQDKSKLIKNMKLKNPSLARELAQTCLSFDDILSLNDDIIKVILSKVSPAILGLALNLCHTQVQRKILGLIPRQMALKAFEVMQKDLSANHSECLRAQNRILQLALTLYDKKIIDLLESTPT